MFWLVYEREGKKVVVIERAGTLIQARLQASIAHDLNDSFVEGHKLPAGATVPPAQVGKLLSAKKAGAVLRALQGA